jgi:hypothetical protein
MMQLNVTDVETGETVQVQKRAGSLPIMLQSTLCHLRGLSRDELVRNKEEADEFGGTFICNGIERVLRLIVQQRRHYVMALRRGAYKKRGVNYTEFGTLIRCDSYASVVCTRENKNWTVKPHVAAQHTDSIPWYHYTDPTPATILAMRSYCASPSDGQAGVRKRKPARRLHHQPLRDSSPHRASAPSGPGVECMRRWGIKRATPVPCIQHTVSVLSSRATR